MSLFASYTNVACLDVLEIFSTTRVNTDTTPCPWVLFTSFMERRASGAGDEYGVAIIDITNVSRVQYGFIECLEEDDFGECWRELLYMWLTQKNFWKTSLSLRKT
jgi:hypothetical protein